MGDMLRYVCPNPNCLHTFLSPKLEFHSRCELCKRFLLHFGKPEKETQPSPSIETMTDLKEKYASLTKKSLDIGLTDEECIIMGRAFRKLGFDIRKQIIEDSGLWQNGVIYKHVMIDGLLKMVIDKRKMNYERKKREKYLT
jgi:hypothetical protein